MPSSKGLLILLLSSQLLSIHGQVYYKKQGGRHDHSNSDRPTTSPLVDTGSPIRQFNPSYYETPTYPYRSGKLTLPHDNYQECRANAILNFARVGLKRIGDAFIESSETKELYLDDNDIGEISSKSFALLNQLEVLSLSNNMIPTEKLLWFSTIYTLRKLVVDDNRYSSSNVTKMLETLPRLEELSLQRNNISRFAINLKEFAPKLTHLRLCGNKIDDLDFLDDLPDRVSYLYLDDNRLTKVRSIALKNVRVLSVSGNQIEKLCYDQCTENFLSVKNMSNLEKLNASRNSINEITDDAFLDTINLLFLDLSRNRIKMFPARVLNLLINLQELSLSHNKLGSVPKMCSLIHLKHLDLSYNNIGSITVSDLCNTTTRLHTLLLSGNHITEVDNNAFMQLPVLKKLDLSNNLILNLPVRLIHGARSLQTLLLKNNSIAKIDYLFTARSNVLQELHLQENPFCTVRYEGMQQLVIHLKDQTRQEDATNNHDDDDDNGDDNDDENSVNNVWP